MGIRDSAKNGAEHDGDRLPHLHHPGVDEADHHDRRRRGRLDDGGDAGAQQQAAERRAAQLIKNDFEPVAGHLFQPLAHQRHAEEEERHAAKQRDQIGNSQNFPLLTVKHTYAIE